METISGKLLWIATFGINTHPCFDGETDFTYKLTEVNVPELILNSTTLSQYVHGNQADIIPGFRKVEVPVIIGLAYPATDLLDERKPPYEVLIDGRKRIAQAYANGNETIPAWVPVKETEKIDTYKVFPQVVRFIEANGDMRIEKNKKWYSFTESFNIIDDTTIRTRRVLRNRV
jgi:hypothetical protein